MRCRNCQKIFKHDEYAYAYKGKIICQTCYLFETDGKVKDL